MKKITIDSAGRVAYGVAMIVFGILHFTGAESLLKLIPSYMPGGAWLWVYIVGTALILAGTSIILKKYDRLACLLLALMFTLFILMVRVPYLLHIGDGQKEIFIIEMSKEIALAGSALVIAGRKKKIGSKEQ